MRTLMLLTLVGSLIGCASPHLPEFPDIKDHYMVEVRDEEVPSEILTAVVNLDEIPRMESTQVVRCLHFAIISKIPYKIKFLREEMMKECHLVGGYKPKDSLSLYNWLDDAEAELEKFKRCFKK